VVSNKNKFKLNSDVYNTNTIQKHNFHQPATNLSLYQKGVYSTGKKVFKSLPQCIKNLSDNPQQFKSALKNYLHANSSYSTDEYFTVNE
jgi:hypothetical protein